MPVSPPPTSNQKKNQGSLECIIVPMVAEILLISASVLWLLVYLKLPIEHATAGMLFVLLFGSFICWKNLYAAEAILYGSLFLGEYVIVAYFNSLIIPCIIFDVLVVLAMTRLRQSSEE